MDGSCFSALGALARRGISAGGDEGAEHPDEGGGGWSVVGDERLDLAGYPVDVVEPATAMRVRLDAVRDGSGVVLPTFEALAGRGEACLHVSERALHPVAEIDRDGGDD